MNVQLSASVNEKQAALFNAFLKLSDQHGIQGVSMSLLAAEAGVAAGTIYHYFDSKEELILTLFKHVRRQTIIEIFHIKHDLSKDYKESFIGIWVDFCFYYINHLEILCFIDQFYSSPYRKLIKDLGSQFCQNDFTSFLDYGVEQGYIKNHNLEILTNIFVGSIVMTAKKHMVHEKKVNMEELKTVASIVWDGLKLKSY